jgi:hypothetical protein
MRSGAQSKGPPASPQRFLRTVGFLWLVVLLAVGIGALLAPHLERIADFVLHQTAYRHWTRLVLPTAQPFFEASSPEAAVKSYYSALYRNDIVAMERLTTGPLREQMRQHLAQATDPPGIALYSSYLQAQVVETQSAVVVEKFHLFWPQGLRFTLQRHTTGWRLVDRAPLE